MRYSPDIAERILKELEKVPNIRYVCIKVGIDHSTFYRWLLKHPSFQKEVIVSLFLGREVISGAAETVIIKGVQAGEHKSATFWLTHQDPKYMSHDKAKQYGFLMSQDLKILKLKIKPENYAFEALFKFYDKVVENYDEEIADHWIEPMINLVFADDAELIELFNIANKRRRKERSEINERLHKAGYDENGELI